MRRCPQCGIELPDDARFCFRDGTKLDAPQTERRQAPDCASDEPLGQVVGGRYHIIARLGEGGMGAVYLARQLTLGKLVAVKFLRKDQATEESSIERFLIEARAAARLDHPNIVSIYDFGRDGTGGYYLVMEYVEGHGLHELLPRETFDQLRSINILRQLFSAAAAAHQANIVHRDLKPENIIVVQARAGEDQVKILDFGLAKIVDQDLASTPLTLEGQFIGTPAYVAPERIRSSALDGRCDLYSIGVIAFELLTGSTPFSGEPLAMLRAHLLSPPPSLSDARPDLEFHPRLQRLVSQLMAKRRDERPPDAEAVLVELDQIEMEICEEKSASFALDESIELAEFPQTMEMLVSKSDKIVRPRRKSERFSTTRDLGPNWVLQRLGGILLELRRLNELWQQRLVELSSDIWGEGVAISGIEAALTTIQSIESQLTPREDELIRSYEDLEELGKRLHSEEGEIRRLRLDLVPRLEILKEALGAEISSESVSFRPAAKPRARGQSDTIELLPGYDYLDDMKRDVIELNGQIEHLDRLNQRLSRDYEIARLEIERKIQTLMLEIRDLHQELAPRCSALVELVDRGARERPDLGELTATVHEITEAINVWRSALSELE